MNLEKSSQILLILLQEAKKVRCLLAIPYSGEFSHIRKIIAQALVEIGVDPILTEEMVTAGMTIIEAVQRAIERSDFVIADVSGQNANVMYELGYPHALGKPLFLILQRGREQIPADLRGFLFLVYNPSQLEVLKHDIQLWTRRFISSHNKEKVR